jgi:hypothetical protein
MKFNLSSRNAEGRIMGRKILLVLMGLTALSLCAGLCIAAENDDVDSEYRSTPRSIPSMDPGDIIHTIPAPGPSTEGLAWDGTYLWASDNSNDYVYQLDPSDGSILTSFRAPPGSYPNDMTWDGVYLWVAVNNGDTIFQITTSGTIVKSFPSPYTGPDGLAWDGEYLWHTDFNSGLLYKLDPADGTVLASYSAVSPNGAAFDGRYVWYVDNQSHLFYKVDPATGGLIETVPSPSGNPRGLTFDGTYLWVSETSSDSIFQIDIGLGVFVTLTPDATIVERGGTLGYTVEVTNNTAEGQTFQYWSDVYLWTGEPYKKNPVFGPKTVTIGAYKTKSGHVSHKVPNKAPLRTYTLCGRIGWHPDDVWDEDCFEFTVVEPSGYGIEGEDWEVIESTF